MIKAEIIADSINPHGDRITSFILTYPRFIHSELMTHRMFSRNAASSRAIPVSKMLAAIRENTARPVYWGAAQAGMQSGAELPESTVSAAIKVWDLAMEEAVEAAKDLLDLGVHKSIANRLVEPFAHMTTLVTATDYQNFFALRAHKDAMPEFQALAYKMLGAYIESDFRMKQWGEWHIPFGARMDSNLIIDDKLKIATARAARLSYMTFDGFIDIAKDMELHDRLAESGHWSPFEHCALASPGRSGNFSGFVQYRKTFKNENRTCFLIDIWNSRPERIGSETFAGNVATQPTLEDIHAMGLRTPNGETPEEMIADMRGEE